MFLLKFYTIVAFVICSQIVFIDRVTGLRCFQCSSLNDSSCATVTQNDMDSPLLRDCPEYYQDFWNDKKHEMFCRSMVQTIKTANNYVRVTRSCGWVKHHKPCYRVVSEAKHERICQCFEDGCNASKTSSLYATSTLIVFAVGALFVQKIC